ncbi:hypothetical protein LTR86_004596 [Recurvomyces mirabilis]|nr:hypothetical protein LTR86_004596 [Recurvomyces mirabilis]
MAHSSPFSRPWTKSFIPVGALTVLVIFFFALHYNSNVQGEQSVAPYPGGKLSHGELVAAPSASTSEYSSVEHTSKVKRKAIVTSVTRKNETTADWLAEFLPDWEATVYVADRTSDEEPLPNTSPIKKHFLPVNQGREAAVYLTYIIQHYYSLPDYMVFIHGKRYQMLDTLPLIQKLRLEHVDEEGYAALRCNWNHCPKVEVVPALNEDDDFWSFDGLYAKAWTKFFPHDDLPTGVTGPCCAQFAVTREAVQRWPIAKYEQIRHWMWTVEDVEEVSMKTGLVLEYMWHIIFGKPHYYCPDAKECWRKKFGMDLSCERDGWCLGQSWLNPEKNPHLGLSQDIPNGWPGEGQSEPGKGGYFPYDGWWLDPEEILNH